NDPNSASSQFYINTADNTSLDGSYAVFGKVISGMSVVTALANVPIYSPPDGQPITPEFLTSVTILSTA
ncbi:MAG TPA: peptidylprolyl isomerase, partial [Candidatus Bathyarchaeia archaeon]|nr:peptidylprolyl isomerase [Candidatus Bathyarchaeia archaeon]